MNDSNTIPTTGEPVTEQAPATSKISPARQYHNDFMSCMLRCAIPATLLVGDGNMTHEEYTELAAEIMNKEN